MTQENRTPLILWAILALNLANSYNLFRSWMNSPLEKISWLLFLIWLLPLAFQWAERHRRQHQFSVYNVTLAGLALLAALMSIITSLNVLAYTGLALAIAAYLPWCWGNLLWLASAMAWMPAFGWLTTHQLSPTAPLAAGQLFRLALVIAGAICSKFLTHDQHENTHG